MKKKQIKNNVIHNLLLKLIKIFRNETIMIVIIIFLLLWYILSLFFWNEYLAKFIDYLTKIFFILWLISTYDLIIELKEWNNAMKKSIKIMEDNIVIYEEHILQIMNSVKSYIDIMIEKDQYIIDYIENKKKL